MITVLAVFPLIFLSGLRTFVSSSSGQCVESLDGVVLRGHVYRSFVSRDPLHCSQECKHDPSCQSLNFYKIDKICELNNRTRAAKPGSVHWDVRTIYFDNPNRVPVGSSRHIPALSCREIKDLQNPSGRYWIDPSSSGKPTEVYCNVTTGDATECYSNPCKNEGVCVITSGVELACQCHPLFRGNYCESSSVPECASHRFLTDGSRNNNTGTIVRKCDRDVASFPGWYRFSGEAGTQIPDRCVPKSHCDTDASGWMTGVLPSLAEGMVTRKICFHWMDSCCYWSVSIQVTNCGPFYVYNLPRPPSCHLRYCGSD